MDIQQDVSQKAANIIDNKVYAGGMDIEQDVSQKAGEQQETHGGNRQSASRV